MQQKRPTARTSVIAALALACAYGTTPCLALTGKEVMEKMSSEQRGGYLTGLVDMHAFEVAQSGDAARSKCIITRFYPTEGNGSLWPGVIDALYQFSDKQAATIIFLLAKKACGG